MNDLPGMTETQPPEAVGCDVERVVELGSSLERLTRNRDRWRQVALAFIVFSLLMVGLSGVQIWGTYASIRLMHETRDLATEQVREIKDAEQQTKRYAEEAKRALTPVMRAEEIEEAALKQSAGARSTIDELCREADQCRAQLRALLALRREIEQELESLREQNLEPLKSLLPPPGHEPDKHCPVKKVVDDPKPR
jgi:hypothetical protein